MATEDNIVSNYLYGELDYIYNKYGEEQCNNICRNTFVNTRKVACASTSVKHYEIWFRMLYLFR